MSKLNILLLFFCLGFISLNAQSAQVNKSGKVEYEIFIAGSESIDTVVNSNNKKMLLKIKKILDAKSFSLEFNSNKAIFKSVKAMDIGNQENDPILKIANVLSKDSKVYYKDISKKEKLKQVKFSGENIVVLEDFDGEPWTITKDTKNILGYKCYRATKKITEYNSLKDETRVFFPEVWFCPEISFPFGPIGLDGLPGLVLEGTINNKFIYRAISVNLRNPNINIPEKLKGKRMTELEYKELINSINN